MSKLKIAIVIGSTRDNRFGPIAADWIAAIADQREELDVDILDLKAFDLPFFNELTSTARGPSKDPRAIAWQTAIAGYDGYIVITAEYNRSITGALKNAFDQAYVEWNNKPIAFLGYGVVGGARAVEHARLIAIELHMVPVRSSVHIGGGEYVRVVHQRQPISEIEGAIMNSAKEMLDQLIWWGNAAKRERAAH
jgi:NAD(P)H-dependent FMN reductase